MRWVLRGYAAALVVIVWMGTVAGRPWANDHPERRFGGKDWY